MTATSEHAQRINYLALKGGLVTPDQALELLHDCDALHLVGGHHEVAR